MKKLVFLENDYKCPGSDEDIYYGKQGLRHWFGFSKEDVDEMPVHYQFSLMERDEKMNIAFNPENILATFSVYCRGSDYEAMSLLSAAARNQRQGLVYLDVSGSIVDFLNRRLRDEKQAFSIICGINSNYILTADREDEHKVKRVTIAPTDLYGECVRLEPCDLTSIFL